MAVVPSAVLLMDKMFPKRFSSSAGDWLSQCIKYKLLKLTENCSWWNMNAERIRKHEVIFTVMSALI